MAFEGLLSGADPKPARWRRAMLSVSLGVHGLVLAAGVAHSLWQVEEMPMPSVEVTLTAAVPPPPPPPPPPAAKKASHHPKRVKVPKIEKELVEPPKDPEPEPEPEAEDDGEDQGEEGGVAGGVKGGVRGGVQGGVVGGVKPRPPPKPRKPRGPQMVSGRVGRQQLLINPNVDPYRVKVPRALARSGAQFSAVLRVCVSERGRVTSVSILKGAGAAIDSQIPTVLRRWRYRPLTIGGRPSAFCYPLTYQIR